jgi:hypothetical protein
MRHSAMDAKLLGCRTNCFEPALGIAKPWYMLSFDFDAARKVLTIGIDFAAGHQPSHHLTHTKFNRAFIFGDLLGEYRRLYHRLKGL